MPKTTTAPITIPAELLGAINQTWGAVASDLYEAAAEAGDRITNEAAIECCIDANRLAMYGGKNGKAMDELVTKLIKEHGYNVVMKQLKKELKLA